MTPWLSWVQDLPTQWSALPLRAAAEYKISNVNKVPSEDELPVRLCNYTDVYENEFINATMDFMRATATTEEIRKFGIKVDDVIITKDSESWDDIGIPALVTGTDNDLVCGYHLAMIRANQRRLRGRFLFRCLQAKPIRVQLELSANGVTRFGIPKEEIGKLQLPVPPVDIQTAIANYLDAETSRIDRLMTEKEKLLVLLVEKRRALIRRAVTRGLNASAPLRDSGIPWLGLVPQHWEVWKIGHFAKVGNGSTPNRDRQEYWVGGTNPWLNSSAVNQEEIACAEQLVTDLALEECHLPLVRPKSVLVGITGEGKTRGQCSVLSFETTINQHLAYITPDLGKADHWYLRWLVWSLYEHLRAISDGAGGTKGALTCEDLKSLKILLPPLEEQRSIAITIKAKVAKLDALRAAAELTLTLLKERRAALITAAVTGKLCLT